MKRVYYLMNKNKKKKKLKMIKKIKKRRKTLMKIKKKSRKPALESMREINSYGVLMILKKKISLEEKMVKMK